MPEEDDNPALGYEVNVHRNDEKKAAVRQLELAQIYTNSRC